jgi:hypothetical protein
MRWRLSSAANRVRLAHQEGRRLFIATANLKTRRLGPWDLGAIACSGRPDAGTLVRKLLLAACSFQGVSPTVALDVEVYGRCYREEHSDAGPVASAILRFGPMPSWPPPGAPPRVGWRVPTSTCWWPGHCIRPPCPAVRGWRRRFGQLQRGDFQHQPGHLESLHHFCAVSGMQFHRLSLPADYPVGYSVANFDPDQMPQLLEYGRKLALEGYPWPRSPPGSEPWEEEPPPLRFALRHAAAEPGRRYARRALSDDLPLSIACASRGLRARGSRRLTAPGRCVDHSR